MSLIPYQTFFDFDRLWKNMKLLPDGGTASVINPRVEIAEKDNQYLISAEFPGVESDKIDITLENGILTLSAETESEEKKEEKGKVIYQERTFGRFSRSFNVGKDVSEEDIVAKFKDGVLTLTLPKSTEQEQRTRRIPIHS